MVPAGWLGFPFTPAWIALIAAPVWIAATLLTRPVGHAHLLAFYDRVRPGGPGWVAVVPGAIDEGPTIATFVGIAGGFAAVIGCLPGVGEVLFGRIGPGLLWLGVAAAGAIVLGRQVAVESRVQEAP